jgi:diaminohydroxyphosphoribosylaminopyrimidine deaminase/5-amino-6-(5-phosphoribosylamino)uracil reductase
MKLTPKEAMSVAIEEGRQGAGFVSPNPLVGCVILDRDGNLIGKGYHAKLGALHAEMHALSQVKDRGRLEGAHMYVTLEPCAHEGRQPSCAKALAALPIASVTYGLEDPNPKVSGEGAAILRRAGKQVTRCTELQDELEELAEIFLVNMREQRPFVSVKVASSLDGKIALADGSSQWITGESARGHVQSLRGFYDAVLTGMGTYRRDNPRLNSRDPRFASLPQKLVLLDPRGESAETLAGSNLLTVRRPQDVYVVTAPGARCASGANHVEVALENSGEFDFRQVLAKLREAGIHSVFTEAGAHSVSAIFRQKLADRLYLFLAPKLLGKGLSWTSGMEISALNQAIGLKYSRLERFGDDLLVSCRVIAAGRP